MFTPGQTALISGLTAREVYRRVEAGEVHFIETIEGLVLVCFDSLLGYIPARVEVVTETEVGDHTVRLLPTTCSETEDYATDS